MSQFAAICVSGCGRVDNSRSHWDERQWKNERDLLNGQQNLGGGSCSIDASMDPCTITCAFPPLPPHFALSLGSVDFAGGGRIGGERGCGGGDDDPADGGLLPSRLCRRPLVRSDGGPEEATRNPGKGEVVDASGPPVCHLLLPVLSLFRVSVECGHRCNRYTEREGREGEQQAADHVMCMESTHG